MLRIYILRIVKHDMLQLETYSKSPARTALDIGNAIFFYYDITLLHRNNAAMFTCSRVGCCASFMEEVILSADVDVGAVATRGVMKDEVARVADALDIDAGAGFTTNPSTAAVADRNTATAADFIVSSSVDKVAALCDEKDAYVRS